MKVNILRFHVKGIGMIRLMKSSISNTSSINTYKNLVSNNIRRCSIDKTMRCLRHCGKFAAHKSKVERHLDWGLNVVLFWRGFGKKQSKFNKGLSKFAARVVDTLRTSLKDRGNGLSERARMM